MAGDELILQGLRVIDAATYIAAPAAAAVLSDFGAEVIKIERPPHGDPFRHLVQNPEFSPSPYNTTAFTSPGMLENTRSSSRMAASLMVLRFFGRDRRTIRIESCYYIWMVLEFWVFMVKPFCVARNLEQRKNLDANIQKSSLLRRMSISV